MQVKPVVLIGAAIGVLGMLLGWSLPSVLQGAQHKVDDEASVWVEKARRVLYQYNAALGYKSTALNEFGGLLAALSEMGVEGEFDFDDPSGLSEEARDDYQTRHSTAWESFPPTDWRLAPPQWKGADPGKLLSARPRRPQPSYGNVDQQIIEGARERSRLIKENAALLQEAIRYVDQALNVSSGEVNARAHVEANRLKGVIYYHQGLTLAGESAALRRRAMPLRGELQRLDAETMGIQPLANLTVGSTIDKQIFQMEGRIKSESERLRTLQGQAEQVDGQIRELQMKIADAEKRVEAARQEMDRIKARGVDFSDPRGGEAFAEALLRQDQSYRSGIRELQGLQYGTLPGATLEAGGDLLSGRYVESGGDPAVGHGLNHYLGERAVLTREIAGQQAMLKDFETTLENMRKDEEHLTARMRGVSREINGSGGLAERARKVHEQLAALDQAAFDLEEAALEALQKSAQASKAAASAADRLTAEAAQAVRNLPPARQDRSALSLRKDDNWMGGYIAAAEADARLARAWVLAQRYQAYSENKRTYTGLFTYLRLKAGDPTTDTYKSHGLRAEEARTQGVEEIGQVMNTLADVHRKVGQHWTITALAGGARSVMVLFDYPEYRKEAIEDYRNALKGREDKDYARWISARLAALEAAN